MGLTGLIIRQSNCFTLVRSACPDRTRKQARQDISQCSGHASSHKSPNAGRAKSWPASFKTMVETSPNGVCPYRAAVHQNNGKRAKPSDFPYLLEIMPTIEMPRRALPTHAFRTQTRTRQAKTRVGDTTPAMPLRLTDCARGNNRFQSS